MSCWGLDVLPAEMHQWALESIAGVYRNTFDQAEESARKIIRKYPDHPAGYFFYASAINSWMNYYRSNKREEEFFNYCDKAVEKSERLRDRQPKNMWARFFIGGAEGSKGNYEASYQRWITAFRYGWRGVSVLHDIRKADTAFVDVLYGIGKYDYWRSALSRVLWWMPNIDDRRESGIVALRSAMNSGIFTREAAAEELVQVLNNESRFDQSLAIANSMLEKYPNSLTFLWGKAAALVGLGRFDEAEKLYRYLLISVEAETFDNHYNAVLCHFYLADIYSKSVRKMSVAAECKLMDNYKLSNDVANQLKPVFEKAAMLKKLAAAR